MKRWGFAGAVERFLVGQQPFHPRSKPQIVSGISALEGGGEGLSAAIDGANIAHKEAKKKYRTPCAVFDEALKDEMARAIRLQAAPAGGAGTGAVHFLFAAQGKPAYGACSGGGGSGPAGKNRTAL